MTKVRWRSPARYTGQAMLPVAAVGGTMLASRLLLPVPEAPGQPALVTMIYAVAGVFALLFFCPRIPGMRAVIGWSAAVALLVTAIAVADPATRELAGALPALSMTLFLMCTTLLTLRREVPTPLLFTVLALLTFLPLVGGPFLETAGNPPRLTDAVVAASPLTAIAVALDLDYLRTAWFYANSALGSLRYDYPDWLASCLLLAFLPAAALFRAAFQPPHRFQTADEAQNHENETSPLPDPVASPLPVRAAGGRTGPRSQGEGETRGRRGTALPAHQPDG